MSAPSQTPSTPPNKTKPVPPNAPKRNSTTNEGGTTAIGSVSRVVAFNHQVTELFDSVLTGANTNELVLDISASVSGPNALLLRTAVAVMTRGTNAHGQFVIPKPHGRTGIINAIRHCTTTPKGGTIYLFTDGEENCYNGSLEVGTEPDGQPKLVHFSGYNAEVLADHLQHLGVKVCILGIGQAAQPMVAAMIGRKNVFVGHIDHGADIRAVTSVVKTLKHISKGGTNSATRGGTQHALLVTLNVEVQESIKNLSQNEVDQIEDAVKDVIIANSDIVCPSDLKRHIQAVLNKYDEDISAHVKDINAGLLLAMHAMCDGPMPAAMITSKHSAVIGVPGGWRDFRRTCNRLFSQLAKTDILNRAAPVPEGGMTVKENGNDHRFAGGCAQYSCDIPKSVVANLAEDEDFCTARQDLPAPKIKKRKRSPSGTAAKKQRLD